MADDTPKTAPPTQQDDACPPPPPPQQQESAEERVEGEADPTQPPPPVVSASETEPAAKKAPSAEELKSDSEIPTEKQEPPVEGEAAAPEKEVEKSLPPPPPLQESVVAEPEATESAAKREEPQQPPESAAAAPEPEVRVTFSATQESVGEDSEKEKVTEEKERKIPQSHVSFKEESNVVADLSDSERAALQELKQLVSDALKNHLFTSKEKPSSEKTKPEAPTSESDVSTEKNPSQDPKTEEKAAEVSKEEDVSIWGIPLLKDDRSDVILLKFLRAREFKVKDAFAMLKNTIQWRREFGIDALIDEDLGDDLEKVVFMHGHDRDGHPVCYNVYGEFQNKDLYQKTLGDEEKRAKFLRWRIQFLEKSIRKLDFNPGGINTIFQVNDLRNSPGPGKKELRLATKQALQILQDNYPEFVAKQVFINVPWWYLAFYTMISPFLTQRTKSKFVFAGPSKTPETLFKYISPEQVPVQYGGLSVDYCDCNPEFTVDDPVTEMTVKPGTKQTVEIIIYEKCVIVWELRVVGWEVSYGAEFVPNAKDAYTVIIHKPTKLAPTDEPVVSNSFRVSELGKVLLTIDNPTSKKKKLLYRFKVDPLNE